MNTAMAYRHDDYRLVAACVAGSIALHVWLMIMLPSWNVAHESLPPLIVELAQQQLAPEIELPTPLPLQPRNEVRKPEQMKPLLPLRAPQTTTAEKPLTSPVLTAPPEAVTPSAPVIAAEPRTPQAETQRPRETIAATPPRFDAAYLNNPQPPYPLIARRRGDQGTAMVKVVVTAEGNPANVNLEKSSGSSALDEVAVSAVKTWRFVPARLGAQAVESPVLVPVVFKLN